MAPGGALKKLLVVLLLLSVPEPRQRGRKMCCAPTRHSQIAFEFRASMCRLASFDSKIGRQREGWRSVLFFCVAKFQYLPSASKRQFVNVHGNICGLSRCPSLINFFPLVLCFSRLSCQVLLIFYYRTIDRAATLWTQKSSRKFMQRVVSSKILDSVHDSNNKIATKCLHNVRRMWQTDDRKLKWKPKADWRRNEMEPRANVASVHRRHSSEKNASSIITIKFN